ncbi:hypothetical protein ABPG72_012409 [Tetrahymena utriculariae]
MSQKQVASVIVFGDIGRSPRMKNHSTQLASAGYEVYFVGQLVKNNLIQYVENQVHKIIRDNPNIKIIDISSNLVDKLKKLPRFLYLLYAALRIIIQIFQLFYIYLFKMPKPEFVIIQNPPSIPVLSSLAIICFMRRIKMIVDFHNYGYTILALGLKQKIILKLATFYEKYFAKKCDFAFCVSDAMKADLKKNWNIEATTLYDKANTELFGPIPIEESHKLFLELGLNTNQKETLFTQEVGGKVEKKKTRPLLLVSSTSWTKDEVIQIKSQKLNQLFQKLKDFSILLDAMQAYETAEEVNKQNSLYPKLHLLITGKGPEKERYQQIIEERKQSWKNIQIQTVWLKAEDYPKLLASADVGICLHYSSSGLDLPMKVVDMLGSNLPVFAINYQCINELVANTKNGYIFDNTQDLLNLFLKYFKMNPENEQIFESLRKSATKFRESTWEKEWQQKVLPILNQIKQSKNNQKNK